MSDGKILIMGVGGCGSGFIVRVLENCGLDTMGFNSYIQHGPVRAQISAGVDPKKIKFPKVIKHLGGFINNLNEHIDRHGWGIEHIFFAVASYDLQLYEYVKRRGKSSLYAGKTKDEIVSITETDYPIQLGKGLLQLIERDHPFTVVRCPKSIKDAEYCYSKLGVVLGNMSYEEFKKAHDITISLKHLKRLDKWG